MQPNSRNIEPRQPAQPTTATAASKPLHHHGSHTATTLTLDLGLLGAIEAQLGDKILSGVDHCCCRACACISAVCVRCVVYSSIPIYSEEAGLGLTSSRIDNHGLSSPPRRTGGPLKGAGPGTSGQILSTHMSASYLEDFMYCTCLPAVGTSVPQHGVTWPRCVRSAWYRVLVHSF